MCKNLIFKQQGFACNGYRNFTPNIAYQECLNGAILVDVREKSLTGYKQFDIPVVIFLPLSQLKLEYNKLPTNKPLIFADSVGLRSSEAMQFMKTTTYGSNIANLAGGLVEWEHDNLPITLNKQEQLDGSCMCQLRPRHKK